jgi:predicted nucleotidyltransferase
MMASRKGGKMGREEVLTLLASHHEELKDLGVHSLSLFGSIARDEAGAESDVDILVEFARPVGLFAFLRLQDYLEGVLGRRVDLVTVGALRPEIRERIVNEAVRAA